MNNVPNHTKRTNTNVTVLAIDSKHDALTKSGFDYREKHVYPYLQTCGLTVKKLQGPLARRGYVATEAVKPETVYLTGIGHGLYDLYTGEFGHVVFRVAEYRPEEVRGKIVHFLSCKAARDLGRDFVRNGSLAYFGYDEDFTLVMDEKDVFFECDSETDRALAEGLTAAETYERVVKLFDRRIAEFDAAGKPYAAAVLEFDRDHLRCPSSGGSDWGDPNARLT